MRIEKVEKLAANLQDKTEYVKHTKKFETSIKSWISFKKKFIKSLSFQSKCMAKAIYWH